MEIPHSFGYTRQVVRCLTIFVLSTWSALATQVLAAPPARIFDVFLTIDAQFLDQSQVAAARGAFELMVRDAGACAADSSHKEERGRCVIDALFASGQLTTVEEPGNPESSTVTSVLVSHKGNCAALTAVALSVAERVNVPLQAVVFPRHVVVRSPGDPDNAFELLQRGAELTMAQLRKRLGSDGAHDTRVRANAFPAYYMDNLAVRFAEAGDADRAEAMFQRAIDDSPRMGRVRFNYGTFLLGKDRLEPAKEQLRRAVRLDSRNAPAWANLGVAVARLDDTAEARRCFERALRYEPHNRIANDNLKALGPERPPPPR